MILSPLFLRKTHCIQFCNLPATATVLLRSTAAAAVHQRLTCLRLYIVSCVVFSFLYDFGVVTAGYSDVRIIGFDGEGKSQTGPRMKTSVRAGNAVGGRKFSVVPYGGSKPEHPNVRMTLSFRSKLTLSRKQAGTPQ